MSTKQFILSSAGLKNIIFDEREFKFSIGGKEIIMNTMSAEFLSPFVSRLHHCDPTIDSIIIDIPSEAHQNQIKEEIDSDIINILQQIGQGSTVNITKKQSDELRKLSILLSNSELYLTIQNLFSNEKEETYIDQILNELKYSYYFNKQNGMNEIIQQNLINKISEEFYSIEKTKLKNLPLEILHKIIIQKNLRIESEDELFELINFLFEEIKNEDDKYSLSKMDFYEEINISELSDENFIQFFNNLDRNNLSDVIWNKLCKCIGKRKINKETNKNRYINQKPKYKYYYKTNDNEINNNQLNGIIRHLIKENGGNLHDKGIIEVTASSALNGYNDRQPKFAVDLDKKQTRFASENKENSWLQYDFKNSKVHPTYYAIMSKPCGEGDWHPQSWAIEGSNDAKKWKIIDSRSKVSVLNGKNIIHTFNIQENLSDNEFFRYLRIRQTGLNVRNDESSSGNILAFSSLEYYGTIIQ